MLRQTISYLPAQLLGPVLQLSALVVWTYWLSPPELGTLIYLVAAHDLCIIPVITWWSAYVLRYGGALSADDRRRLRATERAVLLGGTAAQVALCLAALWLIGRSGDPRLLVAFVAYGAVRTPLLSLSERARAEGDVASYTVINAVAPAVGLALGFAALGSGAEGAWPPLAGLALGQAVALAWAGARMGLAAASIRPDRPMLATALRFGGPIAIATILSWVSLNGIRLVVEALAGVAAVGLLSVGWNIGQRLTAVAAMLVTAAAFPLAVKRLRDGDAQASGRQMSLNAALLLAVLAPATAGMILVSGPMIDLLVAEPFRAVTKDILPIAVLAGSVRNFRMHFIDQAFLLFERPWLAMWLFVGEAALTIGLCAVGVMRDGIVGAALGCLAAAVLTTLSSGAVARALFGLRFPVADGFRIAVGTAAMTGMLVATPWPGGATGLALQIGFGVVIYVAMLALLSPARARDCLGAIAGLARRAAPARSAREPARREPILP